MKMFYGIVEDRNDPLKIGRVRVRVHGVHSPDKNSISTPDLPWAQVLLPTTSAGLSGFGTQHGLVEGSTVFGFFRDGDTCQQPVVLGSTAGIPQVGYKEGVDKKLIERKVKTGFNDPRELTVAGYENTPDGPNPKQDARRGFGLTTALDTAPTKPETLKINYDGTEILAAVDINESRVKRTCSPTKRQIIKFWRNENEFDQDTLMPEMQDCQFILF